MKRPAAAENNLERIKAWRKVCPNITIRSTFIVGFPGETEAEFEELITFLEEAQLDRVGCFTYSPVEGAAANELPDPVPEQIKEARLEKFMTVQASISAKKLQNRVGGREVVLIDEVIDDVATARSFSDAPEIDGVVHVAVDDYDITEGDFIEAVSYTHLTLPTKA